MNIPYKHLVPIASMTCLLAAAAACATSEPNKPDAGKAGGGGDAGSNSGGAPGGNPGSGAEPPPPETGPFVYPPSVHTGFDSSHTFKVPVTSDLVGVTWSVEDPSIATIQRVPIPADYGNRCDIGSEWAMVTPKKAGTTRIFARTADQTATATLVVASYDPAIYGAGERRYNTPDNATAAQRASCASCHKTATGVDHSPFTMAGYADDDILAAITTGVFKHGYQLTGVNHAWNLTDAEKQGIMPYLRALAPRGF